MGYKTACFACGAAIGMIRVLVAFNKAGITKEKVIAEMKSANNNNKNK